MYPLKFVPILKSLVWGGEKIAPFKHIETSQHNIGESWELSGVRGNESVVANGEYAGRTISELVAQFKDRLIGKRNYARTGNEFPLLIKFIDAKQDLSIQVHPNDELAARRHNGSKGKTEMWYVVGADRGAHLMSGLSREITPEEYAARVEGHTITDVLRDYAVSPGDVFFLPAGRIHSIGAGSFIAEIQQTSDITYRIYDFGRLGLDGKPRELHTALAKDAIDYTVLPDYRTAYTRETRKEQGMPPRGLQVFHHLAPRHRQAVQQGPFIARFIPHPHLHGRESHRKGRRRPHREHTPGRDNPHPRRHGRYRDNARRKCRTAHHLHPLTPRSMPRDAVAMNRVSQGWKNRARKTGLFGRKI